MREIHGPKWGEDTEALRSLTWLLAMGSSGFIRKQATERLGDIGNIIALRMFVRLAGEPTPGAFKTARASAAVEEKHGEVESSVELLDTLDEAEELELAVSALSQAMARDILGPMDASPLGVPPEPEDEGDEDEYELGPRELEDCTKCNVPDCPLRRAPYDGSGPDRLADEDEDEA